MSFLLSVERISITAYWETKKGVNVFLETENVPSAVLSESEELSGGEAIIQEISQDDFFADAAPLPDGYSHDESGNLFYLSAKGYKNLVILECLFAVVALLRNYASQYWSIVVHHCDIDGKFHTHIFKLSDVVSGSKSIVARLADSGLAVAPGAAEYVIDFIQRSQPHKRVILANHVGYLSEKPEIFVLPHTVVGDTGGEEILFQPEANSPSTESMRPSGSLAQWQKYIAEAVKEYPLAMFAILAAFSGPLLKPLQMDGAGFHFFGPSSRGKSTILGLSSTIWGRGSDPARDGKSFVQRWLTTANALEGLAACHNDTLIALDELGTFAGTDLGAVVYMLAGGAGKSAMDSHRRLRSTRNWSCTILSSGEKTIRDAIEEGGRKAKAGQLLRIIDIPAGDIFPEQGVMPMSSGDLVNDLKVRSATYYGTAGPAFVAEFIKELQENPEECLLELRTEFEEHVRRLTPENVSPEQGRVIRRFGLVEVAGIIASNFGIIPYTEEEIHECVARIRDLYLNYTPPIADAQRGLAKLQEFIVKNHTSLPSISDPNARVSNAKGFRGGNSLYLMTDEQLASASGVSISGVKDVVRELREKKFLVCHEPGRLKCKHKVASAGNKFLRFYAIKGTLLEADFCSEDTRLPHDADVVADAETGSGDTNI